MAHPSLKVAGFHPPLYGRFCLPADIDSTVETSAGAYAGVRFNTMFLNHYHLRNREIVSLLDDYLHDWPMLCELGDRPKEWLEHKGKGVVPLSGKEARRKQ